MDPNRWRRSLLTFLIVFGALTAGAVVVRAVVLYRHYAALGLQMDDPDARAAATAETTRLDRAYAPAFVAGATLAAGAVAVWTTRRSPADDAETR